MRRRREPDHEHEDREHAVGMSWLELDLMAILAQRRGWNACTLTPEQESTIEIEYDRVMAAPDPLAFVSEA